MTVKAPTGVDPFAMVSELIDVAHPFWHDVDTDNTCFVHCQQLIRFTDAVRVTINPYSK